MRNGKLNYKTTYKNLTAALTQALYDLSILSGDVACSAAWQDVAGTAAINLRHTAALIDNARIGNAESGLVFPSAAEIIPTIGKE